MNIGIFDSGIGGMTLLHKAMGKRYYILSNLVGIERGLIVL